MRIGFLGKGGAGKTSMSALFALYLEQQEEKVLVVDADLNVHQQQLLGLTGQPKHLFANMDRIKEYVRGSRTDLPGGIITASTPPNDQSEFIYVRQDDSFLKEFSLQRGSLSLLVLGTYQQDDPGCVCYHGMLGAWCLTANHLIDGKGEYVVVDATAGIDNIATPLFYAYDVNFFTVEPTLKSIRVFQDFDKVAKQHDLSIPVVLNKINGADDLEFIYENIPKERVVASINKSKYMKRFDQGQTDALYDLIKENEKAFKAIKDYVDESDKDWKLYYDRMLSAHNKFALSWHNDFHKVDLTIPENNNFSYEDVIKRAA